MRPAPTLVLQHDIIVIFNNGDKVLYNEWSTKVEIEPPLKFIICISGTLYNINDLNKLKWYKWNFNFTKYILSISNSNLK